MVHRVRLQGSRIDSKELSIKVARALGRYPALRKVRFHLNGSKVTLWGRVSTELQKLQAERCLRGIPNLDLVYNRLQVMQYPATSNPTN